MHLAFNRKIPNCKIVTMLNCAVSNNFLNTGPVGHMYRAVAILMGWEVVLLFLSDSS